MMSGTGSAIAKEFSDHARNSPDNIAQSHSNPDMNDTMQTLLDELLAREQTLKEQEFDLATKVKAMELAHEEIARNMAALEQAESKLSATMAISQTAAENDLQKLTAVYDNMKPKDAAALFEAMSPNFSAGFLARMNPSAAAEIMTGLKPETAYAISVILAGRNAAAPTQ
jgi:flagellar motility protein MotE (MotC chaperone)